VLAEPSLPARGDPMPDSRKPHQPRSLPTGVRLLHDPALNKGTAFTARERDALQLRGLLPPRILTQAEQVEKVLEGLRGKADIDKYVELMSLQDRNERLFYRVVSDHLDEMMPLIYTPTVGLACQRYGHLWQRPRGLFVSSLDRGHVIDVLRNWPEADIRTIVVTDGERILGLGDLGANGMGIPAGKLSLYTACAGIDPAWSLPVTLDVGTDNAELLADPLYAGLPERRLRGEAYDALVDEFMQGVATLYPRALVQFEDFGNQNAFRILARYRDRACCFNDDIQGTAAVTLAGLYSAMRLIPGGRLADQRLLFLGAGEAGTGIADLVVAAMAAEGLPAPDARQRCWFVDSKGLVTSTRDDLAAHKRPYAHDHAPVGDLVTAIQTLRPTALIGASGQPQTFTRPVLETMAALNERPIIFALSNPTTKSECTAEQAYAATGGRAIFASGSPFAPVMFDGHVRVPGQANNAYIFPGVALGVVTSRARRVTDPMFLVAARTLASEVAEDDLSQGRVYPPLARIRAISAAIAAAVAGVAYDAGLAAEPHPGDLRAFIEAQMYDPEYEAYV
jgi:malate dehydrogenase (oxaloacetate-decarboxylating)(NADP+)